VARVGLGLLLGGSAAGWAETALPAAERIPAALPGAPPLGKELRSRLTRTLDAQGPDYRPRTRHLREDGSPLYTNRLLLETSPYLRQHAHNPVNWFPWGNEAFEAARDLDRLVLVSIGYSTCHWCHVMEEEVFDEPEIASLLNAQFIAIKVDRELRPDIDAIYMAAAQAMTRRGGWPLNVWVTPEGKPFFAGTYFPPRDQGGRPGFASVLSALSEQYRRDRGLVEEGAERIATLTRRLLEGVAAQATQVPDEATLGRASSAFIERIDRIWGGIGSRFASCSATTAAPATRRRSNWRRSPSRRWWLGGSAITWAAASTATRRIRTGWFRTSRRCSTTTRSWRWPTWRRDRPRGARTSPRWRARSWATSSAR
jgi:hypothetical protein